MLLLGIAACGDTSEMLDDALSEVDVQDAEHFVGELGPTFPVVRSASESTPPDGTAMCRKAHVLMFWSRVTIRLFTASLLD